MAQSLKKFLLNEGREDAETIEAETFKTEGDFVDFIAPVADFFASNTVLRIRADYVRTVECLSPADRTLTTFLLNKGRSDEKEVRAHYFTTKGAFVDFIGAAEDLFESDILFRIRREHVHTVHRKELGEPSPQ